MPLTGAHTLNQSGNAGSGIKKPLLNTISIKKNEKSAMATGRFGLTAAKSFENTT
jgi:hypothetical protein